MSHGIPVNALCQTGYMAPYTDRIMETYKPKRFWQRFCCGNPDEMLEMEVVDCPQIRRMLPDGVAFPSKGDKMSNPEREPATYRGLSQPTEQTHPRARNRLRCLVKCPQCGHVSCQVAILASPWVTPAAELHTWYPNPVKALFTCLACSVEFAVLKTEEELAAMRKQEWYYVPAAAPLDWTDRRASAFLGDSIS